MSRSVTVTRIRRTLLAVAWVAVLAWLFAPSPAQLALVVHPIGSTPAPYGYVELVPDAPGPRPLVVVLHGRGEVGDGTDPIAFIERVTPIHDAAIARVLGEPHPLLAEGAVVVAPQSPSDWDVRSLDALVDHVLASHEIDPDRVYFTGLSMGGAGVAAYAVAHPERLAAVIPICGAWIGSPRAMARLDTLPVRAFHGYQDDVVPPRATAALVASIALGRGGDGADPLASYPRTDATAVFDGRRFVWRAGTSASPDERLTLTEYARGLHGIWGAAYRDAATWRWLFAQRRPHVP